MCDISIEVTKKTVVIGNDGEVIENLDGFVVPSAKKYAGSMPITVKHIKYTEELVNVIHIANNRDNRGGEK